MKVAQVEAAAVRARAQMLEGKVAEQAAKIEQQAERIRVLELMLADQMAITGLDPAEAQAIAAEMEADKVPRESSAQEQEPGHMDGE